MTASAGRASLPMYDWPELRAETDRLWDHLRMALNALGIAAPASLDRSAPLRAVWTDPALCLSQTCGLPYVRELGEAVTLLGAPDYGLPECPPGWYDSAVVVRADDARPDLAAFCGARLALNGRESQSGYAALLHHAAPLAVDGRFFGSHIETGAHEAAARCVAEGQADLAAIDHVSWRHIRGVRPWTWGLRVLMTTDPTPGLPFITACGNDRDAVCAAVIAAFGALDPGTRAALGITGFVPFGPKDYRVLRTRIGAAEARLVL